MAEPLFINRRTAATLCGCSAYTLRRYDRDGKLPNRQIAEDGAVLYAVADLVAAGLLDPTTAPRVAEAGHRSATTLPTDARSEPASAQVRIAELEARLARAEEEVRFLRALVNPQAVA